MSRDNHRRIESHCTWTPEASSFIDGCTSAECQHCRPWRRVYECQTFVLCPGVLQFCSSQAYSMSYSFPSHSCSIVRNCPSIGFYQVRALQPRRYRKGMAYLLSSPLLSYVLHLCHTGALGSTTPALTASSLQLTTTDNGLGRDPLQQMRPARTRVCGLRLLPL